MADGCRDHARRKSARSWHDEGIARAEGGYLKLLLERVRIEGGVLLQKILLCRLEGQKTALKLKSLHTTDPARTQKDRARPRFVARRGRLFCLAILFLFFLMSVEYLNLC
ncbi:hypothetical protein ACLRDC_14660 [Gluconacetobacter sacchari]|uniref:hypothetical protein n=1 Tax=Gluconacetobacter sacchari TaxID=92759 RepID=UPI0039B57BD4